MDLQTFEGLANHHGLVVMKLTTESYVPYRLGDLAGFPPDVAARMYVAGEAVPTDEAGCPIEVVTAHRAPAAALPPEPVLAVPEGWESLHHLRRINLARQIVGPDRALTADEADTIIRAHLERQTRSTEL